jgi:hypothetical protein
MPQMVERHSYMHLCRFGERSRTYRRGLCCYRVTLRSPVPIPLLHTFSKRPKIAYSRAVRGSDEGRIVNARHRYSYEGLESGGQHVASLSVAPVSSARSLRGGRLHNKPVNTDAQGRPLAALAPVLGRGLLSR